MKQSMQRARNVIFVVSLIALIALLGWLSTRYNVQFDWTASGRNSLSGASRDLIGRLHGPLTITAYVKENELLRKGISQLVARYRRHKPDLRLRFVDPSAVPEEARKLGVIHGELRIEYGGRAELLSEVTEQALTNALNRVARAGERWIAYLSGHGERDLLGEANHDLGELGSHLEARGFTVQPLSLAQTGEVPANTSALILAGPRVALLPSERVLLERYIEAGGGLLWLRDPGSHDRLGSVAAQLGVAFEPGVIVDPSAPLPAVKQPTITVLTDYGEHPITRDFDLVTLYPDTVGLSATPRDGWEVTAFLATHDRVWSETGTLQGEIRFDPESDAAGPFEIGLALERTLKHPLSGHDHEGRRQRIVIVGDGDFLSNAFLGNGGNLDLGLNIINWLSHDDTFIAIATRAAPDSALNLSRTSMLVIAFGSLFVLPAALLASGVIIWWRRRRR